VSQISQTKTVSAGSANKATMRIKGHNLQLLSIV